MISWGSYRRRPTHFLESRGVSTEPLESPARVTLTMAPTKFLQGQLLLSVFPNPHWFSYPQPMTKFLGPQRGLGRCLHQLVAAVRFRAALRCPVWDRRGGVLLSPFRKSSHDPRACPVKERAEWLWLKETVIFYLISVSQKFRQVSAEQFSHSTWN